MNVTHIHTGDRAVSVSKACAGGSQTLNSSSRHGSVCCGLVKADTTDSGSSSRFYKRRDQCAVGQCVPLVLVVRVRVCDCFMGSLMHILHYVYTSDFVERLIDGTLCTDICSKNNQPISEQFSRKLTQTRRSPEWII